MPPKNLRNGGLEVCHERSWCVQNKPLTPFPFLYYRMTSSLPIMNPTRRPASYAKLAVTVALTVLFSIVAFGTPSFTYGYYPPRLFRPGPPGPPHCPNCPRPFGRPHHAMQGASPGEHWEPPLIGEPIPATFVNKQILTLEDIHLLVASTDGFFARDWDLGLGWNNVCMVLRPSQNSLLNLYVDALHYRDRSFTSEIIASNTHFTVIHLRQGMPI